MTLRTRLLLGLGVVFLVIVAAGVFTVRTQRAQLYDEVDTQLTTTPLPPQMRSRVPPVPPGADNPPIDEESISDLYLATIDDSGALRVAVRGQRLADVPDLDAADLDELVASPGGFSEIRTVEGVAGQSTFRVQFIAGTDTAPPTIIAVPIDDIEDTIDQLTYTLLAVAALVAVVLVLIGVWVNRFGIRPIEEMTDTADAIAGGDRTRRAEGYDSGTEAGRLATAFNVMLDERDATEQRLRSFVSDASHELRTPLTSIRGYLDLYAQGGFRQPGQLDDAVRRMQGEAARMTLLVEDLLMLAKFDEERPLDLAPFDLGEMVRDVAELAMAAHPERSIAVDDPESVEFVGDRLRLHQALAGLVDNAIVHTPDDASISVGVAADEAAVSISVVDTGSGVPVDVGAAVFDRFTRGDDSRARTTGGSGLGLAIVKSIVEAHDGEISVESTRKDGDHGNGATFRMTFPRRNRS